MVVCTHASGGGINILLADWFSYPTVIPLFMFYSGYLYSDRSEEHIGSYILKKVKKLMIPFYIYTLVYGIIVWLLRFPGFEIGMDLTLRNLIITPLTDSHQFVYNLGGWFIIPLFAIEVINVSLRGTLNVIVPKVKEHVMVIIFIGAGIAGYYLVMAEHNSGWWLTLDRILCLMPFFGMGNYYKKVLEKYFNRIHSFWYLSIILAVNLIVIYICSEAPYVIYSWCTGFLYGPILPMLNGLLAALFWLRIATIMEPVLGRNKWINLVADNSFSIMMNHMMGFMAVKTAYALLSKVYAGFADFDMTAFKTDVWYLYMPKGVSHTLIIYVAAGIAIPIFIQKLIDACKASVNTKIKRQGA